MHVVAHQAECMDTVAEPHHAFSEQAIETVPIADGKEDVLTGVAAQDDVIQAARDMEAGFPSHAEKLLISEHKYNIAGLAPIPCTHMAALPWS